MSTPSDHIVTNRYMDVSSSGKNFDMKQSKDVSLLSETIYKSASLPRSITNTNDNRREMNERTRNAGGIVNMKTKESIMESPINQAKEIHGVLHTPRDQKNTASKAR